LGFVRGLAASLQQELSVMMPNTSTAAALRGTMAKRVAQLDLIARLRVLTAANPVTAALRTAEHLRRLGLRVDHSDHPSKGGLNALAAKIEALAAEIV
jgi:hypothetical protein